MDAVVFDYGGVLTSPIRSSMAAWMRADGIEPESVSRTMKAWFSRDLAGTPIHRLETGELSVAEFDILLAAELTSVDGGPVDPNGLLGRVFAGVRPDPAMFALARELRALGVRVGLLSNSWGNNYPRQLIDGLFDPVVISGEVGLRKPLAPIYHLTLARLGMVPDRVVFVDDAEPNVHGARTVGMETVLHTGADSTRAALADLIPALPSTSTAKTGVNP